VVNGKKLQLSLAATRAFAAILFNGGFAKSGIVSTDSGLGFSGISLSPFSGVCASFFGISFLPFKRVFTCHVNIITRLLIVMDDASVEVQDRYLRYGDPEWQPA